MSELDQIRSELDELMQMLATGVPASAPRRRLSLHRPARAGYLPRHGMPAAARPGGELSLAWPPAPGAIGYQLSGPAQP